MTADHRLPTAAPPHIKDTYSDVKQSPIARFQWSAAFRLRSSIRKCATSALLPIKHYRLWATQIWR